MKKIIALALSLIMLLGCVSALAESKEGVVTMLGGFSIEYGKLPEGYKMTVINSDEMEYEAIITSSDPAKVSYILTMAFSDEWSGVNTLADATEDDMNAVKASFYEVGEYEDGEITFEEMKTGEGTPVLVAKTVDGAIAAAYTIYKSHEIEIVMYHEDEKLTVTDDEIKTVIDFLTNVKFVEEVK